MIKGIFSSLFASLLFGGLYFLGTFLRPLTGEEVFGFRMVVTLPFLLFAVFLLRKGADFADFLRSIWRSPRLICVLLLSASLVGVQMWLFLWAPSAGYALEVSIGYLLMPITMVAVGKWIYKEHLSRYKWLAILFAVIGVASNIVMSGSLSWTSVLVCTGYPAYFMVRKKFGISHIHSFVVEVMLLIPIALYFISQVDFSPVYEANPHIGFYLFLLGLMSGTALISYTLASTLVPFNLLGLLGYVEPCLMLLISFLIGEQLDPNAYLLMICLCIAVFLLIFEGIVLFHKKQKKG